MPPSETSQWSCAGAKRISITENDVPPTDGMVSVFCRPPSNTAPGDNRSGKRSSPASRRSGGSSSCSDDCLHIVITDGAHTFYERIASKDIRHMSYEEGKGLENVRSILLRPDDETFKVSYKRVKGQFVGRGSHDSMNTTSIKVSIRKTCINNIVRPVWEGQLDNICHSCYDDLPLFVQNALPEEMNQTESSSGLSFSVMLGDSINKLHNEIDALRTKTKQLEVNTLRWKSTTDKLSNQWETEKSELTDRFLTLFNEHKARHVETQKELDRLKCKRPRTQCTDTNVDEKNSRQRNNDREILPDDEDEHDYATYDNAMVARLAAGHPSSMKRCANNNEKKNPPKASVKQERQNSGSQGSSCYVNPHTGAMECTDVKELFGSSSDDDDDMKT